MKICIEQISNEGDGQKLSLSRGQAIHVGRNASADLVVSNDDKMSGEHFAIKVENDCCLIRNLRSRGTTTVNGQPVDGEAEIHDGDEIVAGLTHFRVSVSDGSVASGREYAEPPLTAVETSSPKPDAGGPTDASGADSRTVNVEPTPLALGPQSADGHAIGPEANAVGSTSGVTNSDKLGIQPDSVQPESTESDSMKPYKDKLFDPTAPLDEVKTQVFGYLNQLQQPLFALVDAARDPLVLALTIHSGHEYQSLFDGQESQKYAEFGAYLVKLPADSVFLRALIRYGWGESWGVYLTSNQSLENIRENLREFLTVKTEGNEEEVLFRFYDPSVMREFLPSSTPEESKQFFGHVTSFYLEGETPEKLLRFDVGRNSADEVLFQPAQEI